MPRCKRGPYQTDRATRTDEMRGSAIEIRIGPTHPNRCWAQCVLRSRAQTMLPARDVDAHGVCRASFTVPLALAGICTDSPHLTTVKSTVQRHRTLRVDWRLTGELVCESAPADPAVIDETRDITHRVAGRGLAEQSIMRESRNSGVASSEIEADVQSEADLGKRRYDVLPHVRPTRREVDGE